MEDLVLTRLPQILLPLPATPYTRSLPQINWDINITCHLKIFLVTLMTARSGYKKTPYWLKWIKEFNLHPTSFFFKSSQIEWGYPISHTMAKPSVKSLQLPNWWINQILSS
jgi:hypothetical protein